MARRALLVGTATYDDPDIADLTAPHKDVAALSDLLADPGIGDYQVEPVVLDTTESELRHRIGGFFAGVGRDDDLLLHFACHGLVDDAGRLFLAATDSRKDAPRWTGFDVRILAEELHQSRARQIVILLDCCFSARFFDALARGDDGPRIAEQMRPGRGRAVLAACGELQRAYEDSEGSHFMTTVRAGLRTGEADVDRDGWVSVDDLYTYVDATMRDLSSPQYPTVQVTKERQLVIARAAACDEVDEPDGERLPPLEPDPWVRGADVHRGGETYILSRPLEEERSPDGSYLWRQGRASRRVDNTWESVWLREVHALARGQAVVGRRSALFREATLLTELADEPGIPRLLATHTSRDRLTLVHTLAHQAWRMPTLRSVRGNTYYTRHDLLPRILADVCATLASLHNRSFAHRALNRDSILLTDDGPVLRDLGLSTVSAVVNEAPDAYQAPEQRAQPRLAGPRTDVYRLAAIAYEILTGRTRTADTVQAGDGDPSLPPGLWEALLTSLGEYESRPVDAAEFAALLGAVR